MHNLYLITQYQHQKQELDTERQKELLNKQVL